MAHLALTFLGSFQAALGERTLTSFRSARVQALLIYLALTPEQPQTRDVLATIFWPDEPESVAKKNLRQSLYQLRQVLDDADSPEEPHLLVTRTTVQFNLASAHSLDVSAFLAHLERDRPEQAIALYQGELLPGFTCDSRPFEAWLREERERLHRLALDALHTLTGRSLARAEYGGAQELAQRQLALEPWREEAHRQLMQALALRGERSAALAQYETCRQVLAEELAAEPSAETEALVARVRAQQLEQQAHPQATAGPARRRLTTPFVGRRREHRALAAAYHHATRAGSQVVALLGEAGIGKTRLVEHFLTWANTQGADILRGRAFETSGRLSYHPLTQALRQRLEKENAPEDLLSDLWLTQLTRILPELRDRYPDLPEPTQEKGTARQHLFEAVARLGQAFARRSPLVIFFDDWHWADSASMDVLHYALLRWSEERAPILVLLTLRQQALAENAELQNWLSRLKHDTTFSQLHLASLSGGETEQIIRALVEPGVEDHGEPAAGGRQEPQLIRFSRWLFEETDGQPFFLVETLKALVEDGLVRPDYGSAAWQVDWSQLDDHGLASESYVLPGVQEIIRGWLERVSRQAGQVLTAASVLGQAASFERLCRVAGLEETRALTALDELLVRQLLLETDDPSPAPGRDPTYSFSHQKLAEAIYAEAGAARRRILHRRAFAALRATFGSAAELAHHAQHAGLLAEAIRYSIIAGNQALRLLAVRVAIAHYETAWQLVQQAGWPEAISGADRQDLYANLGRAYELAEAWPQARKTYQAMITYARTIGASALECLSLNRLATVTIYGFSNPQQAISLLEEARTVAIESGEKRGLAETEWNLSVAARMQQEIRVARHHGERALEIARQLEHPQLLARCLNSLAYVHAYLRHWDSVELTAGEAREVYAAAGNRILEADSQRLLGWSQMFSGRPHEGLNTLRETYAFSRKIENLWGEAECAYRLAHTLLELGRYGEAVKLARQGVAQARIVGVPTMVLLSRLTWGIVQRTVFALDGAEETLLAIPSESTDKELTGFGDWVLAELCARHAIVGNWEQAHTYAKQSSRALEAESLLPISLTGWYDTAALLRGGDEQLARAGVGRLCELAEKNQRYRLPWHRSQAVLAQWEGAPEKAIGHLQEAGDLAREIGLPGEEWSILAAQAALYVEQGNQAEAQAARQPANTIIHRLAETIDEEELRAGFLTAEPVLSILDA